MRFSVRLQLQSPLMWCLRYGILAIGILEITAPTAIAEGTGTAPDFRFDVLPILSKHCFVCHGHDEANREADLRLDVRDAAIEMQAIVPGHPEASELIRRITSDDPTQRMPPPDAGRRLTRNEVSALSSWIANGADFARHWSYEPPRRPLLPAVNDIKWCRTEIDRFILAKLESEGIAPEAAADRHRLIRRVSLDLIGLPPTIDEVDAFVADDRPDAYERLVDRLLASPAYGEHWASKWLDLARYADTNGYEADRRRAVWPYRDWVIDALNSDMPFDQFTIEQLAGDLLPNPTQDQLIATAFHRNTMQNDEGGTDDEEFRVAAVVDRVNTTMQVWMGTTMGCCQCHSHKYDPLTQQEYYQLFAFFNQTADADRVDQSPTLGAVLTRSSESESQIETNKRITSGDNAQSQDYLKLPIMQELPPESQRATHIHVRGSFLDKGDRVQAGTPAAFPPFPEGSPKNRLGLARWLISRENPLTARVVANRQWEQLFGSGIVLTSEDFGSQGELPSHPALLDWLAVELMDHGWSLKYLTKKIVMSSAYCQSNRVTPDKQNRDPGNRLVSRGPRNRLTAEQIRDQALAVSGLLSRKIGGPSVMPPQPEGVWQVVYSDDRWETSAGEDRYRRGLYTFLRRTSPYPSSLALDATSRETCTIRRIATNTPVAAFTLLNDPVYIEAAQSLAGLIVQYHDTEVPARVDYAFRRVVARPPTDEEVARLCKLFDTERAHYAANPESAVEFATSQHTNSASNINIADLAAWTVVSNVLLNLDEALSK